MTLYRETPGELDELVPHRYNARLNAEVASEGGTLNESWCPGGSREEVIIDYDAAISAYHDTGVPHDIEKDIPKAVDAALENLIA